MTRSIAIVGCTLVLCAICVGCTLKDERQETLMKGSVGHVPLYQIDGDQIKRLEIYSVWVAYPDEHGIEGWDVITRPLNDFYIDSLSACLALKSRYEKQAKELEEKMKGVCK